MNFLRALIVSIIGVFLLIVLWPLFILFVLAIGIFWFINLSRLRKLHKSTMETDPYSRPHTSDIKVDEAIDVVFTEKEEK